MGMTNFCLRECGLRKYFAMAMAMLWLLDGISKIEYGPLFVSRSTVDAIAAVH